MTTNIDNDEWQTPSDVLDIIKDDLNCKIVLDLAANSDNKVAENYIDHIHLDEPINTCTLIKLAYAACGSTHRQTPVAYCNPPISQLEPFIKLINSEELIGIPILMLLPAQTHTDWFHDHLLGPENSHVQILFINGKFKFGTARRYEPYVLALFNCPEVQ
jgi:hypothetical protein